MPDYAHTATNKKLAKLEKEIRDMYTQAASETQAKFEDYMRRFKIKDQIKLGQLSRGEITQTEYTKWRYGQVCIGERWQEMVATLSQDLTNADKLAMSMVNGHTPDVYAINHNYSAYVLDSNTHMDLSFTLYDRHTVERLIRDNPSLLPKPKVDIPKDLAWNRKHIANAITQGVLQGESIPQIAKRLQSVAQMGQVAAIRNARTATTGAENAGRLSSYKQATAMGINMQQQWVATLDGRTRHSHRQLDGERIKVGDKWHHYKFSNGCMYPGDPDGPPHEVYNCRCTLIAILPGINDAPASDLSVRNTNKLGGMTYAEWKENKKKKQASAPPVPTVAPVSKEWQDALKYIDGNESDFLDKMNSEFDGAALDAMRLKDWDSLSDDEKKGIIKYTGHSYSRMNKALRGLIAPDAATTKLNNDATSGLKKFSTDRVLYLRRGSSIRALDDPNSGLFSDIPDWRNDTSMLTGLIVKDKAFMSMTPYGTGGFSGDVNFYGILPVGSGGAYVDYISLNPGELEFLIPPGQEWVIHHVDISSNTWGNESINVFMEAIL